MSILPVLLLVGVAYAKSIVPHGNDAELQPIATSSQIRRICAELCMSGLGGEPCGESCLDILPQGLPLQSPNSSQVTRSTTRRDACSVLCSNQLGYPLCQCDITTQFIDTKFKVNFVQICSYFCLKHKYKIYGCQSCQVYEKAQEQHGGPKADLFGFEKQAKSTRQGVDWEAWCKEQCINGDGGAACNCDILPLAASVKNAV